MNDGLDFYEMISLFFSGAFSFVKITKFIALDGDRNFINYIEVLVLGNFI